MFTGIDLSRSTKFLLYVDIIATKNWLDNGSTKMIFITKISLATGREYLSAVCRGRSKRTCESAQRGNECGVAWQRCIHTQKNLLYERLTASIRWKGRDNGTKWQHSKKCSPNWIYTDVLFSFLVQLRPIVNVTGKSPTSDGWVTDYQAIFLTC